MNPEITNIEYVIPSKDKPLGSVSFNVKMPVLHKEGQKELGENPEADVTLSEETVELLNKLSASLINDLEK